MSPLLPELKFQPPREMRKRSRAGKDEETEPAAGEGTQENSERIIFRNPAVNEGILTFSEFPRNFFRGDGTFSGGRNEL